MEQLRTHSVSCRQREAVAAEYGLCTICFANKTHRRLDQMFMPITMVNKETKEYTVYKGYCLQPTCQSLADAPEKLGESSLIPMLSFTPHPPPRGVGIKSHSLSNNTRKWPQRLGPDIIAVYYSASECFTIFLSISSFKPYQKSASTFQRHQEIIARHRSRHLR
jgi:hypothetical protein